MTKGTFCNFNANPKNNRVGDCVVRAICTAVGEDWESVYLDLCLMGLLQFNMPNADYLWGEYLKSRGFKRNILSCENGLCVTVKDFCKANPNGVYIVCPNNHVVAVIDGQYFDTWDCGDEIINYYWKRSDKI